MNSSNEINKYDRDLQRLDQDMKWNPEKANLVKQKLVVNIKKNQNKISAKKRFGLCLCLRSQSKHYLHFIRRNQHRNPINWIFIW